MADSNGWNEYQRLVLRDLERHADTLETIQEHLASMQTQVEMLKFRSGLWGALAGAIPVLLAVVLKLIFEGR